MIWIGVIAGALLGAMTGQGGGGFVMGACVGGAIGWMVRESRGGRVAELERRVSDLERRMLGSAPVPAPAAEPAPVRAAMPEAPPAPAMPVTQAPVEAEPPRESEPAGPGLWQWLIGGNLVAKVGIVILFFGVAFLLRYAYERVHVPVEMRLLAIAAGALALLVLGWRLRFTKPAYALALQGGGVAGLYLVVFGAFRLFNLLPAPLAFGLLVVIAVSSSVLAIAQGSLTLALISISGGFLAPVLASTGQGSHVMLFSYYAVLNAAIVGVAWARAWRLLNVVGFAFTFVISLAWGWEAYRPEHFATTEPFLILFFLMYAAIPVMFARLRAVELKDYVDATLVFGVPLVAFGLQAALVRPMAFGAAWSAFALAVFYVGLARTLWHRAGEQFRLLVESHVALALAFATLAVPLAFDGRLTSGAWALEGAAVVWIGVRQNRPLARAFGYALQVAAGLAFLWDVDKGFGSVPVANAFYQGCLFIAAGALFCAGYVERNAPRVRPWEAVIAQLLLLWGAAWWYVGGSQEITRHVDLEYRTHARLVFFALSSLGFSVLSSLLRLPTLGWLRLVVYPVAAVIALQELSPGHHPLSGIGAAAWLIFFAVHFALLADHDERQRRLAQWLHASGVWLAALLGAREVGVQVDRLVEGGRVWGAISWAVVPAALLAWLSSRRMHHRWPVTASPRGYVLLGGAPLAVFIALWAIGVNFASSGDPRPLPYVPLVNPLDVSIAAVFAVLATWLARLDGYGLAGRRKDWRPAVLAVFAGAAFVCLNGTLLRSLHHWAGVPFGLEPMLESRLVQASFSILWTVLALGAMALATRQALRAVWMAGALLVGVVVLKLLLVDMSGTGTVERIVSFIGVGMLLLVVGYVSPVPPREMSR